MDYRLFQQLLTSKGTDEKSVLLELQEFVREYPYCQTGHMLLSRTMHLQDHVGYDQQLKRTASCVPDRTALFNLLHGEHSAATDTPLKLDEPSPFQTEAVDIPVSVLPVVEDAAGNLFGDLALNRNDDPIEIPLASEQLPQTGKLMELVPEEIASEAEVASPTGVYEDPHEAIRLKLEALLGTNPVTAEHPQLETPATETAAVDMNAEVNTNQVEETIPSADHPSNKDNNTLDAITLTGAASTQPEQASRPVEVIADEQKEASTRPDDEVAAAGDSELHELELEHALEGTFLQSLEDLPQLVIEEEDAENTTAETATGFFSWLQLRHVDGFGQVEMVSTAEEADNTDSIIATPTPAKPASDALALIDRFIETEPRIVPQPKVEFFNPSIQAKRSVEEHDDLVSETLAKIYADQGNLVKARKAYKKLSLLHPQKSTYFATLIQQIDNQLNSTSEDL